jgi:hypothetical protein
MYRVERSNGKVLIRDWDNKLVYSSTDDAYIIYNRAVNDITVEQVKDLKDHELLMALAQSVKLPFSGE